MQPNQSCERCMSGRGRVKVTSTCAEGEGELAACIQPSERETSTQTALASCCHSERPARLGTTAVPSSYNTSGLATMTSPSRLQISNQLTRFCSSDAAGAQKRIIPSREGWALINAGPVYLLVIRHATSHFLPKSLIADGASAFPAEHTHPGRLLNISTQNWMHPTPFAAGSTQNADVESTAPPMLRQYNGGPELGVCLARVR